MPVIELSTRIGAPLERVFDLSRSVDLHAAAMSHTGEKAVGGVTAGLVGAGDEVTWRARHFGVWQRLTSRITAYDRPAHFRDSMVRGAFRRFDHDHFFAADGPDATAMRDRFDFEAPLGILGRLAERWFLTAYMRRFLGERNRALKAVAEGEDWRRFLPPN